ncbi:glutathione S-transferase family protein [Pacificimonas sp. ICDLI1SI03]
MITLYGMGSPNVVKVRIMLEELGLDYEFVRVDVIGGEQFSEEFTRLNPNRKVPVLVDRRTAGQPVTVFESGAILVYLAEEDDTFWPRDRARRSTILSWLMMQMANLGPAAGQAIHFNHAVSEPSYARERFTNELARQLNLLEDRLEQSPFVAGAEYSIADIAVFPWIRTLQRFFPQLTEGKHRMALWTDALLKRSAIEHTEAQMAELTRIDLQSLKTASAWTLDRYFGRIPAE